MGAETFTLTLDDQGNSIAVTINDTSITPPSGEEFFTQSGTFTVPQNVSNINIYAVGAGGGADAGQYSTGSSGGGGGGAYVEVIGYTVTPGDTISVYVGTGGAGGECSTNSPFEIVSTNSSTGLTKYPQSGTITAGGNGGNTYIVHNSITVFTAGAGSRGVVLAGGAGGSGSVHSTVSSLADSHDIIDGNAGENGGSGNGAVFPGGGGGAGNAGRGGTGRGDFYRSNGGYNYHKAANGGQGGGMHLYGGVTANPGSNGNDAPVLYSGSLNYTLAQDGRPGGIQTGNAYGGGAGGGVGGRIRNQTIISGGTNYYYRWFLGKDSDNGTQGAVRFAWGA
jgi:hypothetical protein